MKQLTEFNEEKRFSSLFICDEINKFRDLEGNRSKLRHSDLLAKIEKEFEEEIHQRKISLQFNIRQLPNKGTAQDKYYELTYEQSLQLLMGESRYVRKGVIEVLKHIFLIQLLTGKIFCWLTC